MSEAVLRLEQVRKSYGNASARVEVLRGIDLDVRRGEFTALVGPSGSGKSTLLNLIGLLDRPTSGSIALAGHSTEALPEEGRTRIRAHELGFIFQFHHLIPSLTAEDNVLLPLALRRGAIEETDRKEARRLLEAVGLKSRERARPRELSGGQQQRVAVARALVGKPSLVLADEPTGNLDSDTSADVFSLFRKLHVMEVTTFLIVSHDLSLTQACDRVVTLVDGEIVKDQVLKKLKQRTGCATV